MSPTLSWFTCQSQIPFFSAKLLPVFSVTFLTQGQIPAVSCDIPRGGEEKKKCTNTGRRELDPLRRFLLLLHSQEAGLGGEDALHPYVLRRGHNHWRQYGGGGDGPRC